MIESSLARPKKEMRPILPIKDFEDVLVQLRPDPACRQCYGRGYLSFTATPGGGNTMNLCPCATFGETELLKVLRAIGQTIGAVNSLGMAVSEALARIEKNQSDHAGSAMAVLERIEARLCRPSLFRRVLDWVKTKLKEANDAKEHSDERKGESCPAK